MTTDRKTVSEEAEINRLRAIVRRLFRTDRQPVNDGEITSMSSFIKAIEFDESRDVLAEIETDEQRESAAREMDNFVVTADDYTADK